MTQPGNPSAARTHWAVQALSDRTIRRVSELLAGGRVEPGDQEDIGRATLARELALLDCLDELRRDPAGEGPREHAVEIFRIKTRLAPPEDPMEVLELCAQAVCGDQQQELLAWLKHQAAKAPRAQSRWDQHVQQEIETCWMEIFQGNGLDLVAHRVRTLQDEQEHAEHAFLNGLEAGERRPAALSLASLYHWARATELTEAGLTAAGPLTETRQKPHDDGQADQHFQWAILAAAAANNPRLEILLNWLRTAACLMRRPARAGTEKTGKTTAG